MRNAGLISLVFVLLASCAVAEIGNDELELAGKHELEVAGNDERESVASFSSSWTKLLRYAEDDYLRNDGVSLSCFDVYLAESEREKIVSFLPPDLVKSNGDEFTFRLSYVTECGPSVSYYFNATNGSFVRKVFHRS